MGWRRGRIFNVTGSRRKAEPSDPLHTLIRSIHNRLLCVALKSICKGFLSFFGCFVKSINYAHSRVLSFQRSTMKTVTQSAFLPANLQVKIMWIWRH